MYLFISKAEQWKTREREREREILHPLVHSPNGSGPRVDNVDKARSLKPRAVSAGALVLGPFAAGTLAGCWNWK